MPDLNNPAEYWDSAWKEHRTGWDLGGPTPALMTTLETHGRVLFDTTGSKSNWKVLIPGVGRGYDLAAFAVKPGVVVTGIDISPTGVAEAEKEMIKRNVSRDKVVILCTDFFTYEPSEKFDVVYDHTFLCALQPSLRINWAKAIANLTVSGGYLITYMFPLREPDERGPPFALQTQVSHDLLGAYFEKVFQRQLKEDEIPPVDRSHQGGQEIALWQRKEDKKINKL